MSREPAIIIGFISSVILLVGQQALDSGIVTSTGGLELIGLVVSIVPLISAAIIRAFVTPVGGTDTAGPRA